MALKEQVPNIYSVGLQNVGSYMVSGQPFLARPAIPANGEVVVKFPYVTKSITVRIPSAPNTALGFLANGGNTMRMWTNGGLTPFGNTESDFTFSNWMKAPAFTNNQQPIRLTGPSGQTNYQFRSTNKIRFGLKGGVTGDFTLTNPNDWHHYLITQLTGNIHIYIDGVHKYTTAKTNIAEMNDVNLPPNMSAAFRPTCVHDEITFWTTGMTNAQTDALYNGGEWIDPNGHSKAASLEAWWTMGDGPNDIPNRIHDVADTDQVLVLESTADAYKTFETGPFTAAATGKLRIHMLGTGSVPHGANIYNNFHYYELSGYNTYITLPMKTTELYLSADIAAVTCEVLAELTNIPTGRMYALTGSGIDD